MRREQLLSLVGQEINAEENGISGDDARLGYV
jgi:hypothetical protein